MVSTFYIYSDGSDLEEVGLELHTRIETFIAPYGGRVLLVDQREAVELHSTNLPNWDLGVNFEFDALADEEKKDLLLFFQQLSAEFGREFVLGGALEHGLSEDFFTISAIESLEPSIELLLAR